MFFNFKAGSVKQELQKNLSPMPPLKLLFIYLDFKFRFGTEIVAIKREWWHIYKLSLDNKCEFEW